MKKCEFRLLQLGIGKTTRCRNDGVEEIDGKQFCEKHAIQYIAGKIKRRISKKE